VVGSVAIYTIAMRLPLADPRWANIAAGVGPGIVVAIVCFFIVLVSRYKLDSIGWTTKRFAANVGIGLLALAATYLVLTQLTIATVICYPELLTEQPAAQQAIEETFPRMSLLAVLILNALVVFWEEVVFRGFLLTRLQALVRRWWLTLLIVAVLFGAVHHYEGALAMVITAGLALVMGGLFVWRKSLVPSMTFHVVHNVLIFQLLDSVSETWK